jgi:serine/threonine protein kinase
MGCASSTTACSTVERAEQRPSEQSEDLDFYGNYSLGEKIGRGAFAQVHLATKIERENAGRKPSGRDQLRAVKVLDVRGRNGAALQKAARREASIWSCVKNHENTISLYDTFFTQELGFMVMEKCCSGLLPHLEQLTEPTERCFGKIFSQMLVAIAHCHSVGVVHRDVKPDNFLVGGPDGKTVKLGDFGLSAMLPSDGKLKGVFGTAPYMCPEMLSGRCCNEKADVWSLGVIVYVLLFGTFPYVPQEKTSKGMKQAIVDGATPKFKPDPAIRTTASNMRSEHAISFVKSLLTRDASNRLSAANALKTTYMLAVADDRHALGSELPSLRSMLHSAKKVGAFEIRDAGRETAVDSLLNELQLEAHGTPVPSARQASKDAASWSLQNSQKSNKDSWETSSNTSTTIGSHNGSNSDTQGSNGGSRHGTKQFQARSAWSRSDNSDFAY